MDLARVATIGATGQSVAPRRDPLISPLPQREGPRDVQEGHRRPQPRKPTAQMSQREHASQSPSVMGDEDHLPHHGVMRQVGKATRDLRVVEGDKGDTVRAVPPMDPGDLPLAEEFE